MSYASLMQGLIAVAMTVLAAGTNACLIRAIIGPTTADRLVAVNMTGTQVICLIALEAARTNEGGFADIAVIYALLSFLAVVVLTKILSGKENRK